jgi:hypothetical protein
MLFWSISVKPMRLTPCGEATVSYGREAQADSQSIRERWRD